MELGMYKSASMSAEFNCACGVLELRKFNLLLVRCHAVERESEEM